MTDPNLPIVLRDCQLKTNDIDIEKAKLKRAAIVLCGGKSSRMGFPKWQLPFGDERMLDRILRVTGEVTETQVVVAAEGQALGGLPTNVQLAYDEQPERGPLQGIHAGLKALPPGIQAAYVTSCDVPMLCTEFVNALFALLGPKTDIVVPKQENFYHPLSAVYRPRVLPKVADLLAADRLRPVFLFDQVDTQRISVEALRNVDPKLDSLRNLNDADSYLRSIQEAGLDPTALPPEILRKLNRTV